MSQVEYQVENRVAVEQDKAAAVFNPLTEAERKLPDGDPEEWCAFGENW